MARKIARHDAKIALVDLQKDSFKGAVRLCSAVGREAKGYSLDVTDELAMETLFASIRADFGEVDA
jgi:3-oxoacyl-[acyl-carrier protein] reductase